MHRYDCLSNSSTQLESLRKIKLFSFAMHHEAAQISVVGLFEHEDWHDSTVSGFNRPVSRDRRPLSGRDLPTYSLESDHVRVPVNGGLSQDGHLSYQRGQDSTFKFPGIKGRLENGTLECKAGLQSQQSFPYLSRRASANAVQSLLPGDGKKVNSKSLSHSEEGDQIISKVHFLGGGGFKVGSVTQVLAFRCFENVVLHGWSHGLNLESLDVDAKV